MISTEIEYDDVPLLIEFDYDAADPTTGWLEIFDVIDVIVGNISIFPLLTHEKLAQIAEAAKRKMQADNEAMTVEFQEVA